jgi:hypothetical protein
VKFEVGDRVMTPHGAGVIQYMRMAPPGYFQVYVYSVRLDSRVLDITYFGTMILADDVRSL